MQFLKSYFLYILGANYYLSVRQFLEAEKKIRVQSLVKFGHLSFSEACKVMKCSKTIEDIQAEARKILEHLTFDFGTEIDVGDEEGILYFFAGFCARGEAKLLKCESCIDLFVLLRKPPNIELDENLQNDQRRKFLDQINRGGLFTPTDALYVCVLHARQLYKEVFDKGDIENMIMSVENPQSVFTAMFEMKMQNDTNAAAILDQCCAKNSHKFSERIKSIGDRVFNTFSKNFAGEKNDEINKKKSKKRKNNSEVDTANSSSERKISKLNGGKKGNH